MLKILRNAILFVVFLLPLLSPEMFPSLKLLYPGAVFIVFLFFAVYLVYFPEKKYILSKPLLPLLLLSVVAAASGLLSTGGFNLGGQKLIFGTLFFIVTLNVFSEEEDKRYGICALLMAALFTSFFAFYQKAIGMQDVAVYLNANKDAVKDPRVYEEIFKNISAGRVFSSFLNANVYAGFISLAFFPALGLFFSADKNRKLKAAIALALVGLLAALFLTVSGAGIVTLFAGLIVFTLITVSDKKKWVIYSGVFVLACSLSVLLLRPDIFNTVKEDNSILNRLVYFKDALQIFLKAPLLGFGPETYGHYSSLGVKYPHNWYLQVLSETGILGFTALICFLTIFLKESFRTAAKLSVKERFMFAGIFSGFMSYLIHNLFDIDSNMWQNSLLAFFLAGMVASFFRSNRVSVKTIARPQKAAGFFGKNIVFILAAGTLLLSSVFARYGEFSFLLVFVLAVLLFLLVLGSTGKLLSTPLDLPLTLMLMLLFFSMIISINRFTTLHAVYTFLAALMLFYSVVNSVKTASEFEKYKIFLASLFSLLSLGGIVEYFLVGNSRSFGFFTNPNFLGGFLAAGIGMLLFFILEAKGRAMLFYSSAAVLSAFCMILTKSRGSLLVLSVSLLIFLGLLFFLTNKKVVKEKVRRKITIAILIIFALAVSPLNPVMERAFKVGGNDVAAFSRIKMWQAASDVFLERPFFGYGINTFKDAMLTHYFAVGGTVGNYTRVPHHAHNEYIQLLAESGIAGGLLLLVIIFIFIRYLIRHLGLIKDTKRLLGVCALATGIAGLLVHALIDFNLHFLPTMIFLVLLAGLTFSGYVSAGKYKLIERERYPRLNVYITVLAAVLTVAILMDFSSQYLLSKKTDDLKSREQNLKLSVFLNPLNAESFAETGKFYRLIFVQTKNQKFFLGSEKNFKKAISLEPRNAYYRRNLGRLYYNATFLSDAREEYLKALELAPSDVFIKFELATIFAESGKLDYAKHYAFQALRLEPNFAGARQLLAKIHYNLGEKKMAEYQYKKALEINVKYKNTTEIPYEKMLIDMGDR